MAISHPHWFVPFIRCLSVSLLSAAFHLTNVWGTLTLWGAGHFRWLWPLIAFGYFRYMNVVLCRSVWYGHLVQQLVLTCVMRFSVDWADFLHWVFTCVLMSRVPWYLYLVHPIHFSWLIKWQAGGWVPRHSVTDLSMLGNWFTGIFVTVYFIVQNRQM